MVTSASIILDTSNDASQWRSSLRVCPLKDLDLSSNYSNKYYKLQTNAGS
ncbi:predicted protein [Histoplasma mississippiense (nom. inval.)]|nr:predicted protein [Histoplasma mississippiense (nom. inval.)]EDN03795.1 predicted protein [Histoplasma mississippiense (nom. inval.)]